MRGNIPERDQTGTIKRPSGYKLTFMTEHALVFLQPKQDTRGGGGGENKTGEKKMDVIVCEFYL